MGQLVLGVEGVRARGQAVAPCGLRVCLTQGRLGPGKLLGLARLVWPDEGQPGMGTARATGGAQGGPGTRSGIRSLGQPGWGEWGSGSGVELGRAGGRRPGGGNLRGRGWPGKGGEQPSVAHLAPRAGCREGPSDQHPAARACPVVERCTAAVRTHTVHCLLGSLVLTERAAPTQMEPPTHLGHHSGLLLLGCQPMQRIATPNKRRLKQAGQEMTPWKVSKHELPEAAAGGAQLTGSQRSCCSLTESMLQNVPKALARNTQTCGTAVRNCER